jgi:hypothetical protein
MAYYDRTLTRQIRDHNRRLDNCLQSRAGITLSTYKIIKNSTQLAGAAAGIYAMYLGADPMFAFMLIALIITGPEGLEYALTNGSGD